jgi:hypothetical protein
MSNVLCPMFNVQCPMSNVQCPMSNVQFPMFNVQCSSFLYTVVFKLHENEYEHRHGYNHGYGHGHQALTWNRHGHSSLGQEKLWMLDIGKKFYPISDKMLNSTLFSPI